MPDGTRIKHDMLSQNMFRRVVSRAESRGMRVNKGKTKMLCVSDTLSYTAKAFILDDDSNKVGSGMALKVLGFHFGSRPTCHAHVQALKNRMRETVWVLRHLKRNGFNEEELALTYKTVIRPILDYCCVVYHSLLTDKMDQQVERLQSQALKNIYGFGVPYRDMRERAGVTTLRARRTELCDKFAQKALGSGRFSRWF